MFLLFLSELESKFNGPGLLNPIHDETSRDRLKSAPYLKLKNSKMTSKYQSIGEFGTFYDTKYF